MDKETEEYLLDVFSSKTKEELLEAAKKIKDMMYGFSLNTTSEFFDRSIDKIARKITTKPCLNCCNAEDHSPRFVPSLRFFDRAAIVATPETVNPTSTIIKQTQIGFHPVMK